MMMLVVLVFDLTKFPLIVIYWVATLLGGSFPYQNEVNSVAHWVYCSSTACNPIIYTVMNEKSLKFSHLLYCGSWSTSDV